jgi:hypothetical protein
MADRKEPSEEGQTRPAKQPSTPLPLETVRLYSSAAIVNEGKCIDTFTSKIPEWNDWVAMGLFHKEGAFARDIVVIGIRLADMVCGPVTGKDDQDGGIVPSALEYVINPGNPIKIRKAIVQNWDKSCGKRPVLYDADELYQFSNPVAEVAHDYHICHHEGTGAYIRSRTATVAVKHNEVLCASRAGMQFDGIRVPIVEEYLRTTKGADRDRIEQYHDKIRPDAAVHS